jgi:hypothetical protein
MNDLLLDRLSCDLYLDVGGLRDPLHPLRRRRCPK